MQWSYHQPTGVWANSRIGLLLCYTKFLHAKNFNSYASSTGVLDGDSLSLWYGPRYGFRRSASTARNARSSFITNKNFVLLVNKIDVAIKWCVNEFRAYGYKYKCKEATTILLVRERIPPIGLQLWYTELLHAKNFNSYASNTGVLDGDSLSLWYGPRYSFQPISVLLLAKHGVRLSPIKLWNWWIICSVGQ